MRHDHPYTQLKTFRQAGVFNDYFIDFGDTPIDALFVMVRTRDSDTLTDSNFECAHKMLPGSFTFFTHCWAHGWREWLALPESVNPEVKIAAEQLLADLADYPVLNEDDWSRRQDELANNLWSCMGKEERLYWAQRGGDSIFSIRHDHVPDGAYELLTAEA